MACDRSRSTTTAFYITICTSPALSVHLQDGAGLDSPAFPPSLQVHWEDVRVSSKAIGDSAQGKRRNIVPVPRDLQKKSKKQQKKKKGGGLHSHISHALGVGPFRTSWGMEHLDAVGGGRGERGCIITKKHAIAVGRLT